MRADKQVTWHDACHAQETVSLWSQWYSTEKDSTDAPWYSRLDDNPSHPPSTDTSSAFPTRSLSRSLQHQNCTEFIVYYLARELELDHTVQFGSISQKFLDRSTSYWPKGVSIPRTFFRVYDA